MKTIIFFTRKRARTPKMQALATASGSAVVIRELCRMAKAGEGHLYLVDAPTAEYGRRRIAAFRAGDKPDIGAPAMTTVIDNGRVVAIGANAGLALAGASEAIRHWEARRRRDGGRLKVQDTPALGPRSDGIRPSLPDFFGDRLH
jgi:hypothetical protein